MTSSGVFSAALPIACCAHATCAVVARNMATAILSVINMPSPTPTSERSSGYPTYRASSGKTPHKSAVTIKTRQIRIAHFKV
jgi:hypothetical protein